MQRSGVCTKYFVLKALRVCLQQPATSNQQDQPASNSHMRSYSLCLALNLIISHLETAFVEAAEPWRDDSDIRPKFRPNSTHLPRLDPNLDSELPSPISSTVRIFSVNNMVYFNAVVC
jgi:hypothetical protein